MGKPRRHKDDSVEKDSTSLFILGDWRAQSIEQYVWKRRILKTKDQYGRYGLDEDDDCRTL